MTSPFREPAPQFEGVTKPMFDCQYRDCPFCRNMFGSVKNKIEEHKHDSCQIDTLHVHQTCGVERCQTQWTAAVVEIGEPNEALTKLHEEYCKKKHKNEWHYPPHVVIVLLSLALIALGWFLRGLHIHA